MDFVLPFDQQQQSSFPQASAGDRPFLPDQPPRSVSPKDKQPFPKSNKLDKPDSHHVPFSYAFDIDTYPMTNPPLFDSTMYLNYGSDGAPVLRRRISISNGQIGQIVSHEAVFDDVGVFGNDVHMQQPDVQVKVETPPLVVDQAGVPDLQASQDFAYSQLKLEQRQSLQQRQGLQHQLQHQLHQQHHQQHHQQLKQEQQRAETQQAQQAQQQAETQHTSSLAFAGVPPPNHQLIYNNEVIFNPNNGPIPGTAAWKKDRLLERNRVAASKCRQRKKEAQRQMSVELQELKNENQKLRADLENYNKFYTLVQKYFSNTLKFETSKNYEMYELINRLVNKSDELSLLKSLTELKIHELGTHFDSGAPGV